MNPLRDLWRTNPVSRYYADLPPIDRATMLIILALLFAWTVAFGMIVLRREPDVSTAPIGIAPALTAPPFDMQFAALTGH